MGITRAEKDLDSDLRKKRMVHGETQYKKMSRFLKEIPLELLETGPSTKKEKKEESEPVRVKTSFMQAKEAFKTKAFTAPKPVTAVRYTEGRKASLRSRGPCETYQIRRRNRDCDHGRRKRL